MKAKIHKEKLILWREKFHSGPQDWASVKAVLAGWVHWPHNTLHVKSECVSMTLGCLIKPPGFNHKWSTLKTQSSPVSPPKPLLQMPFFHLLSTKVTLRVVEGYSIPKLKPNHCCEWTEEKPKDNFLGTELKLGNGLWCFVILFYLFKQIFNFNNKYLNSLEVFCFGLVFFCFVFIFMIVHVIVRPR